MILFMQVAETRKNIQMKVVRYHGEHVEIQKKNVEFHLKIWIRSQQDCYLKVK